MRQEKQNITIGKRVLAFALSVMLVLLMIPVTEGQAADTTLKATGEMEVDTLGTCGKSYPVSIKDLFSDNTNLLADAKYELGGNAQTDGKVSTLKLYGDTGVLEVCVEEGFTGTKVVTINAVKEDNDGNKEIIGICDFTIKAVDASTNVTVKTTASSYPYGTMLRNIEAKATYTNKYDSARTETKVVTWTKDTDAPKNTLKKEANGKESIVSPECDYTVTFTGSATKNIGTVKGKATVKIMPVTPTVVEDPTVAPITYDPVKEIKSVAIKGAAPTWVVAGKSGNVAGKWEFVNPIEIPKVTKQDYEIVFNPTDTANYNKITHYPSPNENKKRTVYLIVKKAVPKVSKVTAQAYELGENLGAKIPIGDSAGVKGKFSWENQSIIPKIADSGKTKYRWYFQPEDTDNYEIVTGEATVVVNKKAMAPNEPLDNMSVSKGANRVSDVGLPTNWKWNEKDAKREFKDEAGDSIAALAEYVGEDKESYNTISKTVILTKSNCYHSAIEYIGARKPTCTREGYQGEMRCRLCGEIVGKGEVVPPYGHVYSSTIRIRATATTKGVREYKCIHCAHSYTEDYLFTTSNNYGIITLKPTLQENVTRASVIPSPADIDTAIEGSANKIVTLDIQPQSGGIPKPADNYNLILNTQVQKFLIDKSVTQLTVKTPKAEISFGSKALKAIQEKAEGDATVCIEKMEETESRPIYNICIKKMDTTKGEDVAIEEFETTGITIRIPYRRQMVDAEGNVANSGSYENVNRIKGYYKDASGEKVYIDGSYYDLNTEKVVIPTTHLSEYGVGYKVGKVSTDTSNKPVVLLKSAAKKTSVSLSWTAMDGATKYVVYGAKNGGKFKKLKTTKSTKYTQKKLKKKTAYKYYVKAYLASGTVKSPTIYVYTTGGKYGNQKTVSVTPSTATLKVGGSQSLKVTYKKSGKLKKFTSYVRYYSDNPSVAKVSSKGVITGLASGSCNIYVYTMNGFQTGVKVTVGDAR
ncbi:MAG: hypothetical protein E7277_02365 [Lachnospiraceae bacterium]|jgi:hypothetical protein|nr:hypothetical protein [Lachnospiraceae bacterium]